MAIGSGTGAPADAEGRAPAGLAEVFPGETVELRSIGRAVIVKEWPARALVHEVPAKVGTILAKLYPLAGQLARGAVPQHLPAIAAAAMADVAGLVLWTAGLEEAVLERLTAGELMRLAAAGVRQNRDFFAGLAELRAALGAELAPAPGDGSPSD